MVMKGKFAAGMPVPSAKLSGSTLHLMTCWLQVFTTEMRNVPPQKGYIFFNDINKDDNDDKERVDEVV